MTPPIPVLAWVLAVSPATWRALSACVIVAIVAVIVGLHLRALLRPARRVRIGQHITRVGVVFSLVTLAVSIVALHTKINFLVLLFGMLLSGLVLSFVLSRIAMRGLAFERLLPGGVHAGESASVELRVRNAKWYVSSYGVGVWDDLPEGVASETPGGVVVALGPGRETAIRYDVAAVRRGVFPFRRVAFSSRFPFGFFHQGRARDLASELVVYPRLGVLAPRFVGAARSLAQARRRAQTARGEEEFRNLREYRHGDNPRLIHWKTSAKLGTPLVREFEAVVSERAFILLDTRCEASGDEPLEAAISFAATLARDLMLHGFAVSLAAYAPELIVTGALRGAAAIHQLLDLLARLEPNPDRSLADLVAEPDVRAAGRLLTVVAMRQADDRTAAAIRELRGRQHRVVAVDASAPEFHALFLLPPPPAPAGEGGRTLERSASA